MSKALISDLQAGENRYGAKGEVLPKFLIDW
jgi:hypothetical protein